jgi:cobyrinic acid a,c-diamide synthase
MNQACASVTVAGLGGDSGKTLVALGLAAGWTEKGLRVAPFKKGPDYIDAAWLSLAAKAPCRNLDTFLMSGDTIRRTWESCCQRSDISLIEGNRGLFDGLDAKGSHSTAELAKRLESHVLLVVDATKVTATLAALVLGVRQFDPSLRMTGVVLNRVAGSRHEKVAREAIETHTDVKVLGAIPRLKNGADLLPGRHLGLVTVDEHPAALAAIDQARSLVLNNVDIHALMAVKQDDNLPLKVYILPHTNLDSIPDPPANHVAQVSERQADSYASAKNNEGSFSSEENGGSVRVGVILDSAFSFYYPENLEALERGRAEIVRIDSLKDESLPADISALYIGGGFPETHAKNIAGNKSLLSAINQAAEAGLPIYAECGGLMLLSRSIEFEGVEYPMAGVFPHRLTWSTKPAGHGYTVGEIESANQFYPVGTRLRGHEFHHSQLRDLGGDPEVTTVMQLNKGSGVGGGRDGLCYKNVLAMYTHVHAAGTVEWAVGMLAAACRYRDEMTVI